MLTILRGWADVEFEVQINKVGWDHVITSYDSITEQRMVEEIKKAGIRPPDAAHLPVPKGGPHILSADLWYEAEQLAVLLHGPIHDKPHIAQADKAKETEYRSRGGRLLVIRHDDLSAGIAVLKEWLQ